MFKFIIAILLLILIFILYNCNSEHFSQKNKKIHMMKVNKSTKHNKPNVNYHYNNHNNQNNHKYRTRHNYYNNNYYYDYPNYWYEYLYPRNWTWSWWGYPSEYDPVISVPYYQSPVNLNDNCHKKCVDRYENETDTEEYLYKVDDCINEYCY